MQIDQIAEYRYPSLVLLESVLFDNFDIVVHRSYLEKAHLEKAPMRESASWQFNTS